VTATLDRTDATLVRAVKVDTDPPVVRTATGYGRKLPTAWLIKYGHGRDVWRRVYCVCFSNSGTLYILINKEPVYLDQATEGRLTA
jgi:hypothetical protein